jgi:hypothetical protein
MHDSQVPSAAGGGPVSGFQVILRPGTNREPASASRISLGAGLVAAYRDFPHLLLPWTRIDKP